MKTFLPPSLVVASLFIISCAGQVAPSGGPPDSIPPAVVWTEPDTNAVRVSAERIVLEFSEYVDRRSAEESVFISPYVGELEFDWSGREVTMTFTEALKKNTTYVVNIGTDVKDLRASNRMAQAFTLAFSTGDSIDQGKISGRVFDEKPEGVMMFAYALDKMNPDTLNPSATKPDYITQTGKDGAFTFSNIRLAKYRLFAVRDEYRNLVYDKQVDDYGVTTRDVTIAERRLHAGDIRFRLSKEDSTKPFITKTIPLHRSQVLVRFSERLDTASLRNATVRLTDTLGQRSVPLLLTSFEPGDSLAVRVVTSTGLDSGKAYMVSVEHVSDVAGNRIDSAGSSAVFTATGTADTLKPALHIVGITDSIREIPVASAFEIRFSEPVKQSALAAGASLFDSARKEVPHARKWITASSMILTPETQLRSKAWYSFRVVMDSLQDYSGNSWRDSVSVIRLQSLDLKTTGTIEGFVLDADSADQRGDIVLTATRVLTSTPTEKSTRLKESGKFRLALLPEGRYTLSAFRDRDSSLTYSFGKPFPFMPSERFIVAPDTIKVRARWDVEGVVVKLPASPK